MTKTEALEFVQKHIKSLSLIKHMLALGACMKGIAKHLDKDEIKWEVAGILHDVDSAALVVDERPA